MAPGKNNALGGTLARGLGQHEAGASVGRVGIGRGTESLMLQAPTQLAGENGLIPNT